jgi:hypothetical protein
LVIERPDDVIFDVPVGTGSAKLEIRQGQLRGSMFFRGTIIAFLFSSPIET